MVFQNNLLMGAASTTGGTTGGQLWTWGMGFSGRLADGTTTNKSSPVQVGSDEDWVSISTHGSNGIGGATRTDGTIWAWGRGRYGGLGQGSVENKSSPTQIGSDTDWFQIQQGNDTSYGLKTDGTLYFCGRNDKGQGAQGDSENVYSSMTQIGSLTDWKGSVTQDDINGGFNTMAIATNSAFFIKSDGTLWTWGNNATGQLGQGDETSRSSPVQIGSDTDWKWVSATSYHVFAERTDGSIWGWGYNKDGQLGLGTSGSLNNKSSPVQLGSITDYKHFGAGHLTTTLIKADGTLWLCGENSYGQLGLGDTTDRSSPVQVGSDTDWHRCLPGEFMNGATKTDGSIWVWGGNDSGNLGIGDTTNRSSPVQIGSDTDWGNNRGGSAYSSNIRGL